MAAERQIQILAAKSCKKNFAVFFSDPAVADFFFFSFSLLDLFELVDVVGVKLLDRLPEMCFDVLQDLHRLRAVDEVEGETNLGK